MTIRQFLHDCGAALFSEANYYYLKRLFERFCQSFGVGHAVACLVIMMAVYGITFICLGKTAAKSRLLHSRTLSAVVLVAYSYLLVLYTVVFRPVYEKPQYRLELFWSYKRAVEGSSYLFFEIVLNYFLLMPVGFLLPIIKQRRPFRCTVTAGFLFSLSIEFLQLVLRRGLFELDDIMGNVMGCMMGYGAYHLIRYARMYVGK